jgi:hypothetical protein
MSRDLIEPTDQALLAMYGMHMRVNLEKDVLQEIIRLLVFTHMGVDKLAQWGMAVVPQLLGRQHRFFLWFSAIFASHL